jgi:lysophospholipase L1-like esterase
MIFVTGDSFTYGEELADPYNHAWPGLLGTRAIINFSQPGYSNDAIVRSTVETINNFVNPMYLDYAIIAWTTPHRIEVNGKHLTPTSHLKYGSICDHVFLDWNEKWAINKFHTQVSLLDLYFKSKNVPVIHVRTFDVPESRIGNWISGSMVEWMGDCPKGPGGHPLELGHQRIAEHVKEHIRNLGWLP